MKQLICFLLLLFNFQSAFSQDSICKVTDFDIDAIGNYYIVKDAEIIKYDQHSAILNRTSKREFGSPTAIDARDPLRLLVFYRDFGMISILDNQLAEQSVIDLRSLGFIDPLIFAGSVDQGIWIFDRTSSQLIKLDPRVLKSTITIDLRLLFNKDITPTLLEQSKHWVVMLNGNDVLIFDQYGTYVRTMPFKNAPTTLQFKNDDELWVADVEGVKMYNLQLLGSEKPIPLKLPLHLKKARFNDLGGWYMNENGCLSIPITSEIK